VNFTREPLIETVITPKDGYKLVVRNSKGGGQEEYFVDAVEVITFGNACFYRSLEKPKCFLVPVGDYEILEVRESRMVLKTTSLEKGIKIGGGREASAKTPKEEALPVQEIEAPVVSEQRVDKRRERRRYRKRRSKDQDESISEEPQEETPFSKGPLENHTHGTKLEKKGEKPSLIPPPSTLISETIARYKSMPLPEEVQPEKIPLVSPQTEHEAEIFENSEEDEEIPF
jgi:hypothetical protein